MSTSDIEKKMVKISLDNGHPKSVVRAHTLPVQGNVSNKKKMGDKSTASTRTRASLMRAPVDAKRRSGRPGNQKQSPKKTPSIPNASIFTILLSRRLAKNYVARFRAARQLTVDVPKPPTYQLEPAKGFNCQEIEPIVKKIIDGRMRTFRYTPTTAALLTKILSTECKDAVKELNLDRYKVVCQVVIGQKQNQNMSVNSQCAWDTNTDNVVTYTWESGINYCTAMVYGIYHE